MKLLGFFYMSYKIILMVFFMTKEASMRGEVIFQSVSLKDSVIIHLRKKGSEFCHKTLTVLRAPEAPNNETRIVVAPLLAPRCGNVIHQTVKPTLQV